MDPKDPKFLKLQAKWYKKLKSSGFEDQENSYGDLKQINKLSSHWADREAVHDFYRGLDAYLTSNPKIPRKHKKLLEMYSSGQYPIEGKGGIAQTLKMGYSTVHALLKQYREIVVKSVLSNESYSSSVEDQE